MGFFFFFGFGLNGPTIGGLVGNGTQGQKGTPSIKPIVLIFVICSLFMVQMWQICCLLIWLNMDKIVTWKQSTQKTEMKGFKTRFGTRASSRSGMSHYCVSWYLILQWIFPIEFGQTSWLTHPWLSGPAVLIVQLCFLQTLLWKPIRNKQCSKMLFIWHYNG